MSYFPIDLFCPSRLPEKTDIKISALPTATGAVVSTLRGWLETM